MTEVTELEESKFEFQAFRYFPPDEKKMPRYIKRMIFWYGLVIILWIFSELFDSPESKMAALLIFVLCMGRVGFAEFMLDPNVGDLGGPIKIDNEYISYNEEQIPIQEIEVLSYKAEDFFKRKKFSSGSYWLSTGRFTFEPNLSRGRENFLEFTYKDKVLKYYFVLDSKEHMQQFNDVFSLFNSKRVFSDKLGSS